jgi:phosphoribosyl 1,2-cyclic phosphodiesterase
VEVSDDESLVIFDAGTGLRLLGHALADRHPQGGVTGHLFISHFHLDHIQGFPFFGPVYQKGNRFTIYGCEGTGRKLESIFVGQMSPEYFPVTLKEMPADISFEQLTTRPVKVGRWTIQPTYVNHPGLALGYRLDTGKSRLCYMTDNEPFRYLLRRQGGEGTLFDDLESNRVDLVREDQAVVDFLRGVDVLVHDAQYTPAEYRAKLGWGHSFYEYAIALAQAAGVKTLILFHHDPLRSDAELDDLVALHRGRLKKAGSSLDLQAAWEGLEIPLP